VILRPPTPSTAPPPPARPELPERLRSRLGALSLPWRYELAAPTMRAFARAAGYRDPVYYDRDSARAAGHHDLPAAPGFVGTPVYLPELSDETFSEPSFGQAEVPQEHPHVLDLGTETDYERELHAGDVLTGTWRVIDIAPRPGPRTGDGILVVRELTLVDDASGETAARQRRYTLYCERLP
jgi:acyl dehydratase